ncbi:MAG: chemotaxis protein CheW [Elainellaceae cyanobacterium]
MLSDANAPSSTSTTDESVANDLALVSPDRQFLQLYLEAETPALLSILHLVEIISIPMGQVVPIFQMPPWVMGVYNCRGDVLWMVDLNQLLGFSPWYQQKGYISKHTTVIVRSRSRNTSSDANLVLGLVVNRVEGILLCDPDYIEPSSQFENVHSLKPFVSGYWTKSNNQLYRILNADVILDAIHPTDQALNAS